MPERHRILIVDDNTEDREAVVQALRREAAEIDGVEADILEVDTVARAREALQAEEFACVFLDHSLPDGTSLDLLMEVRTQGLTTPIVVLTGQRDEQAIAEVMRAGAVDYLPKERLHPDLVARSLRAALRFLQSQREKQVILDELRARDRAVAAASNGIVLADPRQPDCPLVYVNDAFLNITGYAREEVLGRNCRFLQGGDTNPDAVRKLVEAIREERPCQVSILNYRKDGTTFWNEVTVSPVRDPQGRLTHFVGIQTDVTEKQAAEGERRQAEEALRRSQEDLQLAIDAARLGTFYCDYPLDKITWNDICKQHFFLSPDAEVDFTLFYSLLHPNDREPTRRAIEQALEDRVDYNVEYRTLAPDGRTRWVNAVGRFYYGSDGTPTRFDGITIDISARKAAEEEVLRRAEQEALLSRVAVAIRQDPNQVLETAVRELGQALGADRCYYAAYDQDADTASVGPDWHRDELPSIIGQYPMSRFTVNRDPDYKAGRTQVVVDTAGDAATQALGLSALVRVPLASGRFMTTLSAAMADGPRSWTPEEVALVESVATQTQTALEAVRVQRREHAIAQQLQDALQPALPEGVPGLSVGRFTKPALDEAQIGGDFFDIFPLDKELFAVVIGDVSGKGLAAAQQLALIRNSLRTTLYLYRNPAEAVTNLNSIVSTHDLLVGFVTAWVGVYDAATGQITYASCGHEPGLVRRIGVSGGELAEGLQVEELQTTGPPLGVAQNAKYGELTVTLSSGDALLLYTDGISEAGPSRSELLATTGLKRIMAGLPESADVQEQAEMLVTEVSKYAGGVFRDDVAVLLAQRQ